MSMFPHTITLYNTRYETDPKTLKDIAVNHITILKGVLVDESKASNVRKSGLEGADAVNLYIPFDVEATDPATGERKQYIGPVEFWGLPDKTGYWTMATNRETWFATGVALPEDEIKPESVFEHINLKFDSVYTVTKIDIKNFGGLQHFEVGGN